MSILTILVFFAVQIFTPNVAWSQITEDEPSLTVDEEALSEVDEEATFTHHDEAALNAPDGLLGPVRVVAQHSSKCLDVLDSSTKGGAAMVQKQCQDGADPDSQQWTLEEVTSGVFQIVNNHSGLCLDVNAGSLEDGAQAIQWQCMGPTKHNQLWKRTPTSDGSFQLAALHSGKCLDVSGVSQNDGAQLIQWSCSGKANQLWKVQEIQPAPPWGDADATLKTVVLFKTPKYTRQSTAKERKDLMAIEGTTPLVHAKGNTYFIWVDTDRRPWVTKITDGKVETVPLDAQTDYRRMADGHGRYALGIDSQGYLHISGDMHNYTEETTSSTVGAYPSRYQKQAMLYWRSAAPHSVSKGFEFVGGKGAPTAMPGTGWTYVRFFTDNHGELYFSARVKAIKGGHLPGEMGLGVYRYSIGTRQWEALGNYPDRLREGTYYKVLLWENSGVSPEAGKPGWYQGFFPTLKFDLQNHLHVASSINSNAKYRGNDRVVYAASTDNGNAWQRANGQEIVGLPLRGASGMWASADVVIQDSAKDFGLQTGVLVDQAGTPGVRYDQVWRYWNGGAWVMQGDMPWSITGMRASNKVLIFPEGGPDIYALATFGRKPVKHRIENFYNFQDVLGHDEYALREEGVLYAVGIDKDWTAQSVIKITIK